MINALKLAGASAVLAAVFVVALEVKAEGQASAAARQDLAAAPVAQIAVRQAEPTAAVANAASDVASDSCRAKAWPYVDRGCITSAGEPARKPVRTIAIERRDAPGTSDPVPVPFHTAR